jgi:protein-tyrosine phosphatase
MLALSLAGVPAESVALDYAVLDDRLRDNFTEQLALIVDPTERRQLAESFTAKPETQYSSISNTHMAALSSTFAKVV